MAIDTELQNIRTKISQLQSRKARAQVEYDNATERLANSTTVLKEEFGVTTTAEAKEMHQRLEEQLEAVVTEIQTELEAAGA